jgi:hypothetical protein
MPFVEEIFLAPWEDTPDNLISWGDMQSYSGRMLFMAGYRLEKLKDDCIMRCGPGDVKYPIGVFHQPVDDQTKNEALEYFAILETDFKRLGMPITSETILEARQWIESGKKTTYDWLRERIANIQNLITKEMQGKTFLYIYPDQAKYFPRKDAPYPLGEKVFKAFPSAIYDTNEAAWCLGLSRPTAAVFHLMRILEIGLGALGKLFGVSLAHTNWAPAIDEIEKQIREMHKDPAWKVLPDYKEQQEFYAQAASHFGVLKDAWRNYTMHVRGKYTEREAEQIFANVKGFMKKLSERLSE